MKIRFFMISLFAGLLWMPTVQAETDSQLNAITSMGQLNGIALHCRYIQQMQRIKRAMVLYLPKQRELGALFERSTNDSFLDFINKDSSCPGEQKIALQIDEAVNRLSVVFNK